MGRGGGRVTSFLFSNAQRNRKIVGYRGRGVDFKSYRKLGRWICVWANDRGEKQMFETRRDFRVFLGEKIIFVGDGGGVGGSKV
jgi:hypothetical protein